MSEIGSKRPLHKWFGLYWACWIAAGIAVTAMSLAPIYSAALVVVFFLPPEIWGHFRPSLDPATGRRLGDTLSEFLSHVAGMGKNTEEWWAGWPGLVIGYVFCLVWRVAWLTNEMLGQPKEWWFEPLRQPDHVLPVLLGLTLATWLGHHIMRPQTYG